MTKENATRGEDREGRVSAAFGVSIVRGLLLVALCAATVAALAPATVQAQAGGHVEEEPLLDCGDVATQRGAQALFEIDPEDRFGLDEDGDGVACELPQDGTTGAAAEDGTRLGAATRGDRDCMDFSSQAAAQDYLRSSPSDPYGLDPENNGVACDVGRPAPYEDRAEDVVPVAKARSGADLDCEDFEFQQEAQEVYFQDEGDPNDLDGGERGSAVCLGLPTLWANAYPVGVSADAPGETQTGPARLLAQVPPGDAQSRLVLLLDAVALVLIVSGALALLAVLGRRGTPGPE